jgi:alpha(1,3/1,4) fucosyltransferase
LKPIIKIQFRNGLNLDTFKKEVFDVNKITNSYQFEDSNEPDFIIFGPYGNDIPPKSIKYQRIGYFCENIMPDMSICDWAFGIPRKEEVKHPNYFRIQWHGFDPARLIKNSDIDAEKILGSKSKFCNFIYSHKVAYRERFFTQLSKYKKVDAPGKSMTNMPSIDALFLDNRWEAKRLFQADYKFTLALENYLYPGYQTEKLYDSMLSNSIPVYIGDPLVGEIFNTKSFISLAGQEETSFLIKKIENFAQLSFIDLLPSFYQLPHHSLSRKVKSILKDYKMKLLMDKYMDSIVDTMIAIDKDESMYIKMFTESWLKKNEVPLNSYSINNWKKIFEDI